eukprot:Sspe_Gene.23746::Locus_9284_Transcript_1_1_Confidence_1.000_Length_660::g.23746::m.23746
MATNLPPRSSTVSGCPGAAPQNDRSLANWWGGDTHTMAHLESPSYKEGFLEKYSVGRGFTILRNWKKRYVRCKPNGLTYYKTLEDAKPQGHVKFGFDTTLFSQVDTTIHPAAKDSSMHYFAIQFVDESSKARMLLLRTSSKSEKEAWCSVLGDWMARGD